MFLCQIKAKADNRLTSLGGQAYTWDANGNLLNDDASNYAYDAANRPITIMQGATTYTYLYNGQGDRTRQSVNGTPTNYTLDLNAGLTQVLADSANTYLYGSTRIGEQQSGGFVYHLPDALGSVRQLANASGAVTVAKTYQPFGEVMSTAGSGSSIFGWAGEARDATGLVFLRARFYSPTTGRFFVRDSWPGNQQMPGTLHPYLYGMDNPMMYTDPSGKCAILCTAAIGGLLGAGVGFIGSFASQATQNYQNNGGNFWNAVSAQNINWGEVGAATTVGAISGALIGAGVGLFAAAAPIMATGIPQAATVYGAGYMGYDLLDRTTGNQNMLVTGVGYLTGYENIQQDIETIHNTDCSFTQKLLAGADATFNAMLGITMLKGIPGSIQSAKAAWQLANLSKAERLAYLQAMAAKSGIEVLESNRFYRPLGQKLIEVSGQALGGEGLLGSTRLAGGFFHEMAHVGQEFGALGAIAKPLQQLSAWSTSSGSLLAAPFKAASFLGPGYLLNPAEVNAFSSGLASGYNLLGILESRAVAYGAQRFTDWVTGK